MGLITVNDDNVDRVAAVSLTGQFPEVFDGNLGTLPGIHHLKVDETVHPVVMPSRRIPIAVRPKLKAELDRLTKMDVIAPVDEPTPWVSQILIARKKSGDLRVCIDPRELNKALLREHYTLPILEDNLHELGQSRVFSKADLSSGYWHVELDKESSMLTTFQTCFGRYRWLRLPFGTNVSSEIFQRKLLEALDGLPGVVCIADDVLIHGKTLQDHDRNLEMFLARCKEKHIQLNKDKLELRMSEIPFMGHKISKDGLHSDPEKVKAVSEMTAPKNLEELRRYIGFVNYLAKFLPHLTDVIKPLQNLTKKDVPWVWSSSQQNAFEKVKELVTNAPVLAFYDPNKELIVENDASDYGLGSALFQEGKPVAFASRSLTDAETRYAQIEKDMLAVSFGLAKFHHYTYGRRVTVVTDHQPLVSIKTKPLSKAPRRLQALLLWTQEYNFDLIYKPGKSIPVADTLSRAPLAEKPVTDLVHVSNLTFSPINSGRLNEIRVATQCDETMNCLKTTIMAGWPEFKESLPHLITPYYSYRDELTLQDGIILRGERVVIPAAMRTQMKQKVHAGHMGINSCLRRARELIFWPGMSNDIRQYVESCYICVSHSDKQAPEPLYLHEVPTRPWEKVGTDMFSIEGRNYLVTMDYHSNFFEIDFLPETTAETVVTKLKHHFARHGIPDTGISDGGPQYTSDKFKYFSQKWGFKHETSSPGNSKANGAAEAAVKIAKKLLRKSKAASEDPYLGLLNLRNTPTEGLQTSPLQRLMGRRTKTQLPITSARLGPSSQNVDSEVKRMQDKRATVAQRHSNRRVLKSLIPGDVVRIQPIQSGKRIWQQATVSKKLKSRSYEVTTDDGRTYRRNRQFLRASVRSRDPPQDLPPIPKSPSRHPNVSLSPSRVTTPATRPPERLDTPPPTTPKRNSPYQTRSGRVVRTVEKLNL